MLACRMRRRSRLMMKKQLEHAEGNRWNREETHGRNRFSMVSKEGQPTRGPVSVYRRSLHPTRDGSFRKFKTEHAEFPMNPRCSPGRVLNDHTDDQFSSLLRSRSPSDLPPGSGN
jgi:hypothetical protein